MAIGKYIENYFKETNIVDWNYKSFYKFMRILGYDNQDAITRNYIRTLKEILNNKETDNYKRKIIQELLNVNRVSIFL